MLLLTMSPNAVYGRPRAGLIDDEGNYTMDMTGKTVMITGASRGIGAEAARVYADAGANVVLMARSQDAIADLAGEIGKQAIAIPCNVARFGEMSSAALTNGRRSSISTSRASTTACALSCP